MPTKKGIEAWVDLEERKFNVRSHYLKTLLDIQTLISSHRNVQFLTVFVLSFTENAKNIAVWWYFINVLTLVDKNTRMET